MCGHRMTETSIFKRRLATMAAIVAMTSPLALLMSAPASAQCFLFGCYPQQPQQQQPPFPGDRPPQQSDYSRAPSAKKPEQPPTSTVVVMGDAMADWLAFGLEEAFADTEIGVIRKVKRDSGLIRYENRGDLEWSSVARDIMNADKPAVAVMIIGLSDRQVSIRERPGAKPAAPAAAPAPAAPAQPGQAEAPASQTPPGAESAELQIMAPEQPKTRASSGSFRTEAWAELYSKRIADTIAAMKSRGVPVLWVGLPIIRGANSTSDAIYLNELYRAQAEKAGIIYVDVWEGFVDEGGKFAASGPDVDGQTRRLRSPDGVYFTRYGARKMAHFVEREIRRVISARATPMALPVDPLPSARPEGPVARPVVGAVLPLTAGAAPASEDLLGGGAPRNAASDPIATRVLVKGESISPLKGRADDFVWSQSAAAALPAANMTAEPGTIKPVEIQLNPTTASSDEQKPGEQQAAAQKKPRPPAPVQQQQRPFFSPWGGFFR